MHEFKYPTPKIIRRTINSDVYHAAVSEGFSEIIANVIAAREIDPNATSVTQAIKPTLRDILPPFSLKDLDKTIDRLIAARRNAELISLVVDFDADGQSSLAILYRGLLQLGFLESNLMVHCAHRAKEGYGLNDSLVDRILHHNPPSLIVTADNGSSNAAQIERLALEGIDVIVTDHHALLDGPPPHAFAVVNPVRADCEFPDKSIAGCSVAFMVLIALRQKLIELGEVESSVSIAPLLTFSGVGVQADCVHLGKSMTNRAMVRYALASIQAGTPYVCWDALRLLGKAGTVIDSEFLSFTVAPAINAAGRLDEARHAGDLFLTHDALVAKSLVQKLKEFNEERKKIEKQMVSIAKQAALTKHSQGFLGLIAYLPEGNPGVVGIVASRVAQVFGKPACILAPMHEDPELLVGSLRSIQGYSIVDGIAFIQSQFPSLLVRGGGHQYAGGISIAKRNLASFESAFQQSVELQTNVSALVPIIETDGEISSSEITLELVRSISTLQPFGKGFQKPTFEANGILTSIRMVGEPRVHAQLRIELSGLLFKGIWFFAIESEIDEMPISIGRHYRFVFGLGENTFNQSTDIQLMVSHIELL